MFKLKSSLLTKSFLSSSYYPSSCNFCSYKRSGLLLFSLCTIILLTQQAVALSIPPLSSASLKLPPSSSLVMISPQVNNSEMASMFVPVTIATNVLTSGQRVINAVPAPDRGNFIMYQLAMGLKAADKGQSNPGWQKNLKVLIEYNEHKMSNLKDVPIYGNFATDLLQWLMEKFHLTHQEVYNHLRSRSLLFCTAYGVCYSSDDVICFCCPF